MSTYNEEQPSYSIIKMGRRVDAASAPELEAECSARLENMSLRLIILDMSELDYISSAGLKVILFIAQSLRARQGEVRFVSLKPQVHEIFSMSGFMSFFQEFSSVADAMSMNTSG